MAKNKHQKLADLMQQMLNDIEKYIKDVRRALNLVQLHFYEKRLVYGRPRASKKVIREMMGTYHMGLAFLSPKFEIRKIACEVSWIGMIVEPPLVQEPIHRQTNGWFIPWGVHIVCLAENDALLAKDGLKALLYCPAAHEISEELDWFEEEDMADTFAHVVLTGLAFLGENKLLRQNLLKDPFSFYKEAEDAWEQLKMSSNAPEQPWKIDEIDFEPKVGQSLAQASNSR